MELSVDNWETVSDMAKETVILREEVEQLEDVLQTVRTALQKQKDVYLQLVEQVKPYLEALRLFPRQVKTALESIMKLGRSRQEQKPPERQAQERITPERQENTPAKKQEWER